MPTILLAEDQPITREPLRRLLAMEGYTVLPAASGADALALLVDGACPDLAILDLILPRLSGLDLLATLRGHPTWHTMPVIVLTGSMARSQLDRARELNVHAILHKAKFSIDQLLHEIREVVMPTASSVPRI
jgi:CheY-like chemotaxis protein